MSNPCLQIIVRSTSSADVTRDCDCACNGSVAVDLPAEIKAVPKLYPEQHQWTTSTNLHSFSIDPEYSIYYLSESLAGPVSIAVLNSQAQALLAAFYPCMTRMNYDHMVDLFGHNAVEHAVETLALLGFIRSSEYITAVDRSAPAQLASWIHVTDRCNLACQYCYLPHHPRDMSYVTGKEILRRIFGATEKYGFQSVKLKYAGGEPFLRLDLIMKLQSLAEKLATDTGKRLDAVVLTNGTLINKRNLEMLRQAGLRLMISVDEPAYGGPDQRSFSHGGGSAAKVLANIDLALEYGFYPEISITVTKGSLHSLPRLMEWVLSRKLKFGLNFVRPTGCSSVDDEMSLDSGSLAEFSEVFRVIEENLPEHSLLSSLIDRANLAVSHTRPCGVGDNYLVFDTDGNVAKCQMALKEAVAKVSDNNIVETIRSSKVSVQNVSVLDKPGCRSCRWRYVCAGGCPLAAFKSSGTYQSRSPYCELYQILLPQAIRLEGLRLLKFEAQQPVDFGASF